MSYHAEKKYINPRDGWVKENKLLADADHMPPRHTKWHSFKASFWGVNHFNYSFLGHTVHVDLRYAFKHFTSNTYNQSREMLNGTLLPTLIDPLLVTKSVGSEESLTFYKPFRIKDDTYHMLMFHALLENGVYRFKTIYDASSMEKVKKVIKTPDTLTLYFKHG